MNPSELRDQVRRVVKQFAKQDREPGEDEQLFDSGMLDSFSLPEMVAALEQTFGIRIPDADLNPRQFESLARIERYIGKRL